MGRRTTITQGLAVVAVALSVTALAAFGITLLRKEPEPAALTAEDNT